MIWGGVAAMNGKNGKALVITCAIQIVIHIIWMIDTGSIAFGTVGVLVPICIIVLSLSSAPESWFQAKRRAREGFGFADPSLRTPLHGRSH